MKLHGYLGLAMIIAAEVLLFMGNQFVGHWFTPIIWTSYILFVDALVFRVTRRSLLTTDRLDLLIIISVSIGGWWLFEFYNAPRFWINDLELWWHYHNLEPNPFLRRVGYDWAFATILPALFATAELFALTVFARQKPRISIKVSPPIMVIFILVGAVASIVPLIFPSAWFAPAIWLALILFLDPLNALRGWPSITGDIT